MTDGQLWKSQRRFTIRHLKDLGFGKTKLEHFLADEVSDLVMNLSVSNQIFLKVLTNSLLILYQNAITSSENSNILLDDLFTRPVINVLWAILAGKRFERDEPKMDLLTECMNGFIRFSNGGPNLLGLFPFLRFVAPESTGYNKLLGYIKPIRDYIQVNHKKGKTQQRLIVIYNAKEVIAEHRKTRVHEDPRDFIDVYLEIMDEEKDNHDFSGKTKTAIGFS